MRTWCSTTGFITQYGIATWCSSTWGRMTTCETFLTCCSYTGRVVQYGTATWKVCVTGFITVYCCAW